ncbi:MAG TPA: energy transducer TonB, partial [Vicinamibacteria bacterium]
MGVLLLALLAVGPLQEPSPAPDGAAIRIGGDLQPPRKVKHVVPDYPEDAIKAGLLGVVVLECRIDAEGRVESMRVVQGVPPLTDAAMKAVKKWRY